ncbi:MULTISPECIES: SIMPL domain-containing protein [unclassified Thioalkalivibrio]|uniref:SIMPL domain-containing protein n=1 Tax=unclassified Thioalkalivibrio TaxID=2621013 RepID=UPI000366057D|nr:MULTISPECIES: SIMPL domain-containing protein [unclassified Thioalkalivibrio]
MSRTPFLRPLVACLWLSALLLIPALASADGNTTLTLSGHAERQVENDRMTVQMQAQARAPDARDAAATVNRRMEQALARAEDYDTVEASTRSYTTQAIHDRDEPDQIRAWQVQQTLELVGSDFDSLTELVGVLQGDELTVGQIRFSLSRETQQEHRKVLLEAAMDDWKEQARAMARSLGATELRPVEVELVDSGYDRPQPMMAMRAMDESASQPALEAGTSTVSVTVRAKVEALGGETLRVDP